jgi:hypothetical protein
MDVVLYRYINCRQARIDFDDDVALNPHTLTLPVFTVCCSRVFLSRDPKLKPHQISMLTEDFIVACASSIKCRALNIRASRGFVRGRRTEDVYLDTLQRMQQCEYHVVDGQHHLHLNNPESVAPLINKFLNAPSSKLWTVMW